MSWPSLLDDFDTAGSVLHGLPGAAYVSEEIRQLEQRFLFGQHWVFVGFAHQLPQPGDVNPIELAGLPLFLIRNQHDEICAYHNLCRHRNLKLIATAGNCGKLIRCPYHSWSYDLCGALKNAPYFGGAQADLPPDFKLNENGLLPIACEVWHDWIFVNLSTKPEDFSDFLAPLKRQLGALEVSDYRPLALLDFGELSCNWKLLMENFIEPYHVQFVHRTTTAQPLENHRTVIDRHCLGSAVELSAEQVANTKQGTLGVTSHYLTLFPNFVLGCYQPDQLGVYLNQSLSAQSTRQQRVIYTHRDAHYSKPQIARLREMWKRVHREDHAMCVRLQQGRHSPMAADGGVLSPHWEASVRKFQELVAAAIRAELN